MQVHHHNPQIEVKFHTRDQRVFTTKALLSYQSQRFLAHPTAKATLALQGHHFLDVADKSIKNAPVERVLQGNDLCTVSMLDAKGKRHVDIIGLVKVVTPTTREVQGRPQNATQIQIQGLGQELLQYQIFWHPHIAGRNNLGGVGYLARSKGRLPKGRPNEVIQSLYETFLNDEYVFTLADGRKIHEAIVPLFSVFPDSLAKTALKALGLESAMWSTLKRYSDAPWGELFVDIRHEAAITGLSENAQLVSPGLAFASRDNRRVGLYFRPTPFDFDAWDQLNQEDGWGFDYQESDRTGDGEQLSTDENKLYNFFWAPMKSVFSGFDQLSLAFNQTGGLLPIYDKESIQRHGLRRLEQPTEYVEFTGDSDQKQGVMSPAELQRSLTKATTLSGLLAKRTIQLWKWFGYADKFLEGAIQTRGRIGPDRQHGARMGAVLTRKRDGAQFYVAGIGQQWNFPGPHMTTWTVERGHLPKEYRGWWKQKLDAFLSEYKGRVEFLGNFDKTIQATTGGRFT